MRNVIACMVVMAVFVPTLTHGQSSVSQVLHINTSDIPRYLDWAENSMPIIVRDSQLPTSGGVCVPTYGAEEQGDLYVYNITRDFESLMAVDLTSAVPAREIAKIASHRKIKAIDLWSSVLTPTNLNINAGDAYSMLVLAVSTDQPDMYLSQLEVMESGMHDAGHQDVSFSASQVMTGEFRNHLNVRMIAPTAGRLGAAMDTMRTATWARSLLNNLASIRTVAQQMTVNCHSYVVTQ